MKAGGLLNATTIDLSQAGGSNTFYRQLNLSGGTLANLPGTNLSVDSTTAVTLVGSSTLAASAPYSLTINGAIGGTGAIVTGGNGTYYLAGANTYSGGTNVMAGTLVLSASSLPGSGVLTVANNGTVNAANGLVQTTTVGGLNLGGSATLAMDWGDQFSTAAAAATAGYVRLAPSGSFASGTTYTFLRGRRADRRKLPACQRQQLHAGAQRLVNRRDAHAHGGGGPGHRLLVRQPGERRPGGHGALLGRRQQLVNGPILRRYGHGARWHDQRGLLRQRGHAAGQRRSGGFHDPRQPDLQRYGRGDDRRRRQTR